MRLYLVRHGEAKDAAEDPERGLTDRGREAIEWMAAWASQAGVEPSQIRHSGKKRAEQTAVILADRIQPPQGVVSVGGLAPDDDVRPVVKALHKEEESLMLVGHLPFMGRLASLLLADDPDHPIISLATGQMIGLVREEDAWSLAWSMAPDQIV
jgi:phosphohistidine phosphatase